MNRTLYSLITTRGFSCFIITFFVLITTCSASDLPEAIEYVFPLPRSDFHSPATKIIARFISAQFVKNTSQIDFLVVGRRSGVHDGTTILSSDSRTYIFKSSRAFTPGEEVSVEICVRSQPLKFSTTFKIRSDWPEPIETDDIREPVTARKYNVAPHNEVRIINGISVPSDFPTLVPSVNTDPSDDLLFITTRYYAMLLYPDGSPFFYRRLQYPVWDFTKQSESVISYVSGSAAWTLDHSFELLGEYRCGMGYKTDTHEFVLLPNGHSLLIAYDRRNIDMSKLITGGHPNAEVIGTHIQELDADKNVIFLWRCWDHFDILDAVHENLRASVIRYVHMNAIDVDYDGHLLVSSHRLDEITKINRGTGSIIWRLGGQNNQFTFINDPDQFNSQHDIRHVPDKPGYYTLLDNGRYHTPRYSRAVEYKLDTNAMTAEKVWEYRHTPDRHAVWMGNVDRLINGHTIIGWAYEELPKITQITQSGDIVYEADYTTKETSYRSHRFDWTGKAVRPHLMIDDIYHDKVTLLFNQFGDTTVQKYYIYADTTPWPHTKIDSTTEPFIHLDSLINYSTYYFRTTSLNACGEESDFSNQVETFVHFVKPGQNILRNGDFAQEVTHWHLLYTYNSEALYATTTEGQCHVSIESTGGDPTDIALFQTDIKLIHGKSYRLEFYGSADHNRFVEIKLANPESNIDYSKIGLANFLANGYHYTYDFVMDAPTDYHAILSFNLGYTTGDVFFDDISLRELSAQVTDDRWNEISTEYRLSDNYPNPFNGETSLQYSFPLTSRIELIFYNVLGRVVHSVHFDDQAAGNYHYHLDAENLVSGIYFCRFRAQPLHSGAEYCRTIKLICIK